MQTKALRGFAVIVVIAFSNFFLPAAGRQNWDQQEAVKRVQSVVSQEELKDFRWDKINWLVDPKIATERALLEHKPILLYFFLKGDSGPKEAPC